MDALQFLGWASSVLVVVSLLQGSSWRLRWLNLAGALTGIGFNWVLDVWPMVAMNSMIALIDVYWLWRLIRERHDGRAYVLVPVAPDSPLVSHLVTANADHIAAGYPSFDRAGRPATKHAWVVMHGNEAAALVLADDAEPPAGSGGQPWLDIVVDVATPTFRDFTPGEFLYRDVLGASGLAGLVVRSGDNADYFRRMGFSVTDRGLVLTRR